VRLIRILFGESSGGDLTYHAFHALEASLYIKKSKQKTEETPNCILQRDHNDDGHRTSNSVPVIERITKPKVEGEGVVCGSRRSVREMQFTAEIKQQAKQQPTMWGGGIEALTS